MTDREIDISPLLSTGLFGKGQAARDLTDAIDLASDQDQGTWLLDGGKRIAKIVPVAEAEAKGNQDDGHMV